MMKILLLQYEECVVFQSLVFKLWFPLVFMIRLSKPKEIGTKRFSNLRKAKHRLNAVILNKIQGLQWLPGIDVSCRLQLEQVLRTCQGSSQSSAHYAICELFRVVTILLTLHLIGVLSLISCRLNLDKCASRNPSYLY